jgi:hypothetical protein
MNVVANDGRQPVNQFAPHCLAVPSGRFRLMDAIRISAKRVSEAPSGLVYRCIADYQHHHRPEGFLPRVFTSMHVEQGGVGAGTVIRFTTGIGGPSRTMRQTVSEPEPGRVLV